MTGWGSKLDIFAQSQPKAYSFKVSEDNITKGELRCYFDSLRDVQILSSVWSVFEHIFSWSWNMMTNALYKYVLDSAKKSV